jgi:Domain of unknown function (DUF427)
MNSKYHPITITPTKGRVTVTVNGKRVADTHEALTLKEAAYPAVQYIPRKDVDMTQLQRTSHETYCPYKGECTYYITAFRLVGSARSTPSGPTRLLMPPYRQSGHTWRFTRTGSTPSKSASKTEQAVLAQVTSILSENMTTKTEESNKALVLEAFDTGFLADRPSKSFGKTCVLC